MRELQGGQQVLIPCGSIDYSGRWRDTTEDDESSSRRESPSRALEKIDDVSGNGYPTTNVRGSSGLSFLSPLMLIDYHPESRIKIEYSTKTTKADFKPLLASTHDMKKNQHSHFYNFYLNFGLVRVFLCR